MSSILVSIPYRKFNNKFENGNTLLYSFLFPSLIGSSITLTGSGPASWRHKFPSLIGSSITSEVVCFPIHLEWFPSLIGSSITMTLGAVEGWLSR